MAKTKKAKLGAPVEAPQSAAAPKAVAKLAAAPAPALAERVAELEGDQLRLVELLAAVLGEPFAGKAREIVAKRQGAGKPVAVPH